MRLCYIANPNSIHTMRWLRYFADAERGHEVHLLSTHASAQPMPPGITVHDLTRLTDIRKLRFIAWGFLVRRIVHRLRPDIVHAHQVAGAGWLGAAAGYHPLIVSAWGSDLLVGARRSRAQRGLARLVLRRADLVSCVSEHLAQAALALGADPQRVEIAPLGVDSAVFRPSAGRDEIARLRARFGLGPGPVVLSLRAMRPIYNPLDVAAAIPRILEQRPDAQLAIRTYGHSADVLARFHEIVTPRYSGQVHYIGEQADDQAIAALDRCADIAVSVPSSDGSPVSVLEAMACGAVPVLSDLPSLREWVQEGREGLFVPVGDVAAIANAIVGLLADEPLRAQMRAAGLELIRRRADSRVWMAHAEEMYHGLRRR